MIYKDKPGMISKVSNIIQQNNINIATLHCGRSSKGGEASMCIELDIPADVSEYIANKGYEDRKLNYIIILFLISSVNVHLFAIIFILSMLHLRNHHT